MTAKNFLGDFENDESNQGFSINKNFAKKYEERKRKEELENLKQKYGNQGDESDCSSTSEEEDEDGELLTAELDLQILKTISKIRAKSEDVYDANTKFFEDEPEADNLNAEGKPSKDKPLTLAEYQRQMLLKGAADEESGPGMTYNQEQEELKNEVKAAFSSVPAADEDDEFLTVRKKSEEEKQKEDEEYHQFLMRNLKSDKTGNELFESLLKKNGDDEEKFLLNYVLNKGWVDKDAKRIPCYDEIVDDEDNVIDEEVDKYEESYNFRFEEEDATIVKTYPRNVESARRDDDTRKRQREMAKERKEQERIRKDEEIKRLKNLKKKELSEKLKKIQSMAGVKEIEDDVIDLESDYDPEKFDTQMKKVFNDGYYGDEDAKKPVFDDDIDISDICKDEKDEKEDAAISVPKVVKKLGKTKRDAHDPEAEKLIEKYMQEIYNLDYEDLIGDMPTRFKYRTVEPCTFGLKYKEILGADEKLLNEHVSLKKLAPYRPKSKQKSDSIKYSDKKRVKEFRKHLAETAEKKAKESQEDKPESAVAVSADGIPKGRLESYQSSSKKKRRTQ